MSFDEKNIHDKLEAAMQLGAEKIVVAPPVNQEVVQGAEIKGLILEKPKESSGPKDELFDVSMNTGVGENTIEGVKAYMAEQDADIERMKTSLEEKGIDLSGYDLNDPYASQAHVTKIQNGGSAEVEKAGEEVVIPGTNSVVTAGEKITTPRPANPKQDEEEEVPYDPSISEEKYKEAVVIIDKINMGRIINFTDSEREKMEKVDVIKIKEVELLDLPTKKINKVFGKKVEKILKKKTKAHTTSICLPLSGYTAEMCSCSTYELLELVLSEKVDNDEIVSLNKKWSLIHKKIVSTSIGKLDYNEFLLNTHPKDFETFVYGILVATYGTQLKTLPFTCDKHETPYEFPHKTQMKDLIRAERMDELTMKYVTDAVDNSYNLTMAKEYHNNCPVMQTKLIKLPESEYWVELRVENVHDKLKVSMEYIQELEDAGEKFKAKLAGVATSVARIIIEDEGELYELSTLSDITEALWDLRDTDMTVITSKAAELNKPQSFQYGIMNLTCDSCGNVIPYMPLGIESLLFYMVVQAQNKEVELESGIN